MGTRSWVPALPQGPRPWPLAEACPTDHPELTAPAQPLPAAPRHHGRGSHAPSPAAGFGEHTKPRAVSRLAP